MTNLYVDQTIGYTIGHDLSPPFLKLDITKSDFDPAKRREQKHWIILQLSPSNLHKSERFFSSLKSALSVHKISLTLLGPNEVDQFLNPLIEASSNLLRVEIAFSKLLSFCRDCVDVKCLYMKEMMKKVVNSAEKQNLMKIFNASLKNLSKNPDEPISFDSYQLGTLHGHGNGNELTGNSTAPFVISEGNHACHGNSDKNQPNPVTLKGKVPLAGQQISPYYTKMVQIEHQQPNVIQQPDSTVDIDEILGIERRGEVVQKDLDESRPIRLIQNDFHLKSTATGTVESSGDSNNTNKISSGPMDQLAQHGAQHHPNQPNESVNIFFHQPANFSPNNDWCICFIQMVWLCNLLPEIRNYPDENFIRNLRDERIREIYETSVQNVANMRERMGI